MVKHHRLQISSKFLEKSSGKGHYEIGANVNYSSAGEDDFLNFRFNPSYLLNNRTNHEPFSKSSTTIKLLDSLESIAIELEDSSLPFNGE